MAFLSRLPLLLLLMIASPVLAGQINGSIKDANGAALGGATITILCEGIGPVTGTTKADGRFSIFVPAIGACTFTVNNQNPIKIFSGQQPSRYDFNISGAGLRKR